MPKKPSVICLYCGESFYREDVEYIQVGRRYAHKKCADYADKIHELMQDVLKESYSKTKINKQLTQFYKDGYALKNIYYSLVYWYEVEKGDPSKANGGIGIFPYVYPRYLSYKQKQDKIASTNKGKTLNDYIGEPIKIESKIQPKWKFRRVKFFDLK